MNETRNSSLKEFSQELRREMTKEEKHLWYDFLKDSLPKLVTRIRKPCSETSRTTPLNHVAEFMPFRRFSDEYR